MKAMILAAGRGERMRPLTDTVPKPLLHVHGKALILWHIEKLRQCGFHKIVINIAHLGHTIQEYLGDGSRYGVQISYSDERSSGALESAGGIRKALSLLGEETFLVVNADIFCDYDFNPHFALQDTLAHLILVKNPPHNPRGDFGLENTLALSQADTQYTFSGIGYYNPSLFKALPLEKVALGMLLREAMQESTISAELYKGVWHDIGTPQRLEQINKEFSL